MSKRKLDYRVKDARGQAVSQLDPFTLRLLRRHEIIPPEALDEITGEIGFGLQKGTRLLFIVSIVSLLICLSVVLVKLVAMLASGTFNSGGLLKGVSPFTGVWVGPFLLWLGAYQIRFQRTASVMLRHLRCPHCGYDLRGLPVSAEDGATTCPECGCAWLLESAEVDGRSSTGTHDGD